MAACELFPSWPVPQTPRGNRSVSVKQARQLGSFQVGGAKKSRTPTRPRAGSEFLGAGLPGRPAQQHSRSSSRTSQASSRVRLSQNPSSSSTVVTDLSHPFLLPHPRRLRLRPHRAFRSQPKLQPKSSRSSLNSYSPLSTAPPLSLQILVAWAPHCSASFACFVAIVLAMAMAMQVVTRCMSATPGL